MNELQLRDLLHDTAASAGPPLLDDAAAVDAVVVARGRERRRRTQVLVAAVCVVALAVLVPSVWPGGSAPDRQVAEAPSAAVLDWPTRGSLADDPEALEAVRALPWDGYPYAPDAADRRVLFLGDVAGAGRWALVAGVTSDGALSGQWFAGPEGADPATLTADSTIDRLADVGSVSHSSGSGNTLLVLAAPGDTVEISPRVIVEADGSVRRDWAPVDTEDGVAVTEVEPATSFGSVRYRVLRDGEEVDRRIAQFPFETTRVYAPPQLTPLHDLGVPADDTAVDLALQLVLSQVGLAEESVQVELLWAAELEHTTNGVPTSPPTTVVALAVTVPDGGTVVSTAWSRMQPGGAGSAGTCGAQAHPADTPRESLAVAVNCAVGGGMREAALVMFMPPPFESVEVVGPDGTSVGSAEGAPVVAVTRRAPAGSVARLLIDGQVGAELAVPDHAVDQIVDLAGNGSED